MTIAIFVKGLVDAAAALAGLTESATKLKSRISKKKLSAIAAAMQAAAEDADRAFAHDGDAKDDAQALFTQVAAVAIPTPETIAGAGLVAARVTDAMVDQIKASGFSADFANTDMAEPYFRAIAEAALTALLDHPEFIARIQPQIERQNFADHKTTHAKLDDLLARLEPVVAQTARDKGITDAALIALASRIRADVSDPDQAYRELENAVNIAIRVQDEGQRGSNLGDFVDEVLRRVADLSAKGENDAASAEIDAALSQQAAQHQASTLRLLGAGLEQDLLRRDAAAAAARLIRQADVAADGVATLNDLRRIQDDWYERGRDRGLNLDLEVAIALAQQMRARATTADARGTIMNDLGNALLVLGEREANTARLEDAVTAFRAALSEVTRERVPLDWAGVQMNLGNALAILGEREAGTARLKDAVTAYRAALSERSRERVPLKWAITQMSLGNALKILGQREAGTARLTEAVTAYRAALSELTRERVPLDWATTQMNLGNALARLGQREAGTARLTAAAAAYQDALKEYTRERVPLDWAKTQMNLSGLELAFFDKDGSPARLDAAEGLVQAAREVFVAASASHYVAVADRQLANIQARRDAL